MDTTELAFRFVITAALAGAGAALAYRRFYRRLTTLVRRGERYHSILEEQSELVCRYLPDTTLTYVNSAYCRYFGRTRDELIGKSFLSLLPQSSRTLAQEQVNALLTTRRVALTEHDVLRSDGTLGRQQWTDSVIVGSDGDVVELQAVGRDVTEAHRAKEQFEQRYRDLARVGRTVQFGELTSALTHELSQPVTAILSNVQAGLQLLKSASTDVVTTTQILEDIAEQAQHAGTVIRSLRGLLAEGQSVLRPIDINELILDTTRLLRGPLSADQILVRYQLSPELPMVRADRAQVQQVMVNLIMNALDAMDATDIPQRELVIRTEPGADETVACSFSDFGRGIPQDSAHRILEPFFTTKKHGLGLGLSICHAIITAHEGHLWAINNTTRGATVTFVLPAAVNSASDCAKASDMQPSATSRRARLATDATTEEQSGVPS